VVTTTALMTQPPGLREDCLGVVASETHAALQTDAFKELVNKLSWALGSTYRQPYSGVRSPARQYAIKMAQAIMRDHGYPSKIAKGN